jgi:hypothetical protein
MRRALLLAAALVLFTCTSALADGGSVNYTGNLTFAGDPGLSFSFTEPGTVNSLDTTTTVTITQGATTAVINNSTVQFWNTANSGLFDLEFTYLGTYYDFSLFGAQIYSQTGINTYKLLTGKFGVNSGYVYLDNDPFPVDYITGGKVTAAAVGAPEPAGLAMLGLGIAALVMLRKKVAGAAV